MRAMATEGQRSVWAGARRVWPVVAADGATAVACGIGLVAWRNITFDGRAWLLGGQLIIHGLLAFLVWFLVTDPGIRSTVPVGSPVAAVAGVIAWLPSVRVTDFFPIIIGLYWAAWGIIEMGKHLSRAGVHRRNRLVVASIAVVGGGWLISTWNDAAQTTAATGGVFLILLGLVMMPPAFRVKHLG